MNDAFFCLFVFSFVRSCRFVEKGGVYSKQSVEMMKGAAGHPGVPVVGGNIRSQMVAPQQNLQNYIVSDDIITRQKCVFL